MGSLIVFNILSGDIYEKFVYNNEKQKEDMMEIMTNRIECCSGGYVQLILLDCDFDWIDYSESFLRLLCYFGFKKR